MAISIKREIYVIAAINTLIYMALRLCPDTGPQILDNVALNCSPGSWTERPWTLFSYMWVHIDGIHLAANIVGLTLYGNIALRYTHPAICAIIFLLGGMAGGSAAYSIGNEYMLIGSSAGVTALMGAVTVARPRVTVMRIPLSSLTAAIIITDIISATHIGYNALVSHIGGFSAGIVAGAIVEWFRRREKSRKDNAIAWRTLTDSLQRLEQSGFESLSAEQQHRIINSTDIK